MAVALGAIACGSSDPAPSTSTEAVGPTTEQTATGQTVEFLNNLSGSGDAEGMQRLLSVHKTRHAADTVINTTVTSYAELLSTIGQRTAAGTPPDVFMGGPDEVKMFAPQPINDFLNSTAQAELLPNLYSELVADATVDGKILGLPWGVSRTNVLFYNRRVFTEQHVTVPTTIPELQAVCKTLKSAGIAPIGSPNPFLLQALLVGAMGQAGYIGYTTGTPNEAAVRSAVDAVAGVVEDCIDVASLPAADASEQDGVGALVGGFMNNRIAMFVYIDAMQAALEQMGATPGVDFGLTDPPGNVGLFSYFSVLLAVPTQAAHPKGAWNFLDTAGSFEGHNAFEESRDGLSARKDQDPNGYDTERQGLIAAMKQAQYRVVTKTAAIFGWATALDTFVRANPRDKEPLVQVLLNVH